MTSLTSMQMQVDQRIKQHPDGYFSAEKCFDKLEEEILETRTALGCLIKEAHGADALQGSHFSPEMQQRLCLLRNEVSLELGDVLFALCCIGNKYDLSLESSYYSLIKARKDQQQTRLTKIIGRLASQTPLLPFTGWSVSQEAYPNTASYKVLFHRIDASVSQLRKSVLSHQELLRDSGTIRQQAYHEVRKTITIILGELIDNLVNLAHRDSLDLESSFEAMIKKNRERAKNNYQKETLG